MQKVNWAMWTVLSLFSCRSDPHETLIQNSPIASHDSIHVYGNYDSTKKHISILQAKWRNENINPSILERQFVSVLVDSIFPYWYGTHWDFNGITQIPGKGSIACGYFVSTTLRDAGVQVNRSKVGQMASQQIIGNFIKGNKKKIFSNAKLGDFLQYVQQQGYGVYIVGLDNHVGFLYHDGKDIYFIHAKYYQQTAVVKELAYQSGILNASAYKIVAKLSSDGAFLKNWLRK